MLTYHRNPASWQLILADLALILFLVTAAALTASAGAADTSALAKTRDGASGARPPTELAAAQSLYRPGAGLPTLAQWLAEQPRDPRAALTIVAQHPAQEADRAWAETRAMAQSASALGVRTRVIIRAGEAYDIHASLAYDHPADQTDARERPDQQAPLSTL